MAIACFLFSLAGYSLTLPCRLGGDGSSLTSGGCILIGFLALFTFLIPLYPLRLLTRRISNVSLLSVKPDGFNFPLCCLFVCLVIPGQIYNVFLHYFALGMTVFLLENILTFASNLFSENVTNVWHF